MRFHSFQKLFSGTLSMFYDWENNPRIPGFKILACWDASENDKNNSKEKHFYKSLKFMCVRPGYWVFYQNGGVDNHISAHLKTILSQVIKCLGSQTGTSSEFSRILLYCGHKIFSVLKQTFLSIGKVKIINCWSARALRSGDCFPSQEQKSYTNGLHYLWWTTPHIRTPEVSELLINHFFLVLVHHLQTPLKVDDFIDSF